MAVYAAAKKAIEKVRSGSGPRMLEIMTYRFRGHSMGDPERYRKQEEVKKWEEHDPIGVFHAYLTGNKKRLPRRSRKLKRVRRMDVQKAVEFAEASPEPGLDTLFDNVYVEEV